MEGFSSFLSKVCRVAPEPVTLVDDGSVPGPESGSGPGKDSSKLSLALYNFGAKKWFGF
jgi:hypothetical protein